MVKKWSLDVYVMKFIFDVNKQGESVIIFIERMYYKIVIQGRYTEFR